MVIIRILNIPIDFPFEPYKCQILYMTKVIESLEIKKNAILESPTGTGKTLCLLCATLGWLEYKKSKQNNININTNKENNYDKIKIIYASRTHSQLKQVIKELKNTIYRPNISVMGSREQLCIHHKVSNYSGIYQNQMCKHLNKYKRCEYKNNFDQNNQKKKSITNHPIMDIEELVTTMKRKKVCPFFFSKKTQQDAQMLFVPYNYLIDPYVRQNSFDFTLENCILIFDEAHNIESVATDAASFSLTSTEIRNSIAEIKKCQDIIKYNQNDKNNEEKYPLLNSNSLLCLQNLLEEIESNISNFKLIKDYGLTMPGCFIFEFFNKFNVNFGTFNLIMTMIEQVIECINNGNNVVQISTQNNAKISKLESFSSFLKKIFRDKQSHQKMSLNYRVHISETVNQSTNQRNIRHGSFSNGQKDRVLSYWCFNPFVSMDEIQKANVYNIILTSGTLSPLNSTIEEIGLKLPITLENSHLISADQIFMTVLTNGVTGNILNSSYKNRANERNGHGNGYNNGENKDSLMELGATIVSLATAIPDGVLVFFPSYSNLKEAVDKWKATSTRGINGYLNKKTKNIWESLAAIKRIFVEPRNKKDFQKVAKDYEDTINNSYTSSGTKNGAIFLAICRGKVSEGIDFSDRKCRGVIVTGLPFGPVKDPQIILKKKYLDSQSSTDKNQKINGQEWYLIDCFKAVNQAIGRVFRHLNDYGAILLLDERFNYYSKSNKNSKKSSYLPKFLQNHIKNYQNYAQAHEALDTFFKKNEKRNHSDKLNKHTSNEFMSSKKIENIKHKTNHIHRNQFINELDTPELTATELSQMSTNTFSNNTFDNNEQISVLSEVSQNTTMDQRIADLDFESIMKNDMNTQNTEKVSLRSIMFNDITSNNCNSTINTNMEKTTSAIKRRYTDNEEISQSYRISQDLYKNNWKKARISISEKYNLLAKK